MKRVTSTSTPNKVLRASMQSIFVFLLVVSNSSFTPIDIKSANVCSGNKLNFDAYELGEFDICKPYAALNRRMQPFLKEYMEEEASRFKKMKSWGKQHFDMFERIFNHHGLPVQLKYLSVIESGLKSKAVSVAGAVGPWQIMQDEAIRMGLRVDSSVDERTQFRKSTHAAAKILKELYAQFNDWTLVIAAYNCGAGGVRKAIRKSGSRDFWKLNAYLPKETRMHVKRFIATHFMFEGSGGITTMTASEMQKVNEKIAEIEKWQAFNYGVNSKMKSLLVL